MTLCTCLCHCQWICQFAGNDLRQKILGGTEEKIIANDGHRNTLIATKYKCKIKLPLVPGLDETSVRRNNAVLFHKHSRTSIISTYLCCVYVQ